MTNTNYRKLVKTAQILVKKHRHTTKIILSENHRIVELLKKIQRDMKDRKK